MTATPSELAYHMLVYTGIVASHPFLHENRIAASTAFSTPTWNNSYYSDIRRQLIEVGGTTGCNNPSYYFRFINYAILEAGRSWLPECQRYSHQFVTDFNGLPQSLEGNEQSYVDFCNTYGFYYPGKWACSLCQG